MDLGSAVESILEAESSEIAFQHYNRILGELGYNNACYTLMTDHPSLGQKALHGFATSYPEDWINYYNEQNYQQFDPVWQKLLDRPVPFFWNDAHEASRRHVEDETKIRLSDKVMNQGAEAGVADGIGMSFVSTAD